MPIKVTGAAVESRVSAEDSIKVSGLAVEALVMPFDAGLHVRGMAVEALVTSVEHRIQVRSLVLEAFVIPFTAPFIETLTPSEIPDDGGVIVTATGEFDLE